MSEPIDRRSFLARGAAVGVGIAGHGRRRGRPRRLWLGIRVDRHRQPSRRHHHRPPKKGGQLIFGTESEEKGFSTTQGTFDSTGILYARTVFRSAGHRRHQRQRPALPGPVDHPQHRLHGVDDHHAAQPGLPQRRPCAGAAVAQNFALQQAGALTGPEYTTIANVSVPSPLVVTVTMKTPWVPFDYYLAGGIGGQIAFIAEPTWLKSGSQTNPIGTGPFVLPDVGTE